MSRGLGDVYKRQPLVGRDNRIEIHLVDKRCGLFANLRAAAARFLDDAILLQFRQCLTQRNAADGVLLRQRAFRDKKTVVMTNYGITRGFFLIRPGQIPEGKEEVASLLDGVSRYWKHQTLAQLKEAVGHIDMMVTGASAITPSGIRFGKGHGYFDLEYAMLSTVGLCDETTAIVGAGHDVQVVDVDVTVEDYDTAIDYIVTPTRLIETRHEYPRPSKGIIWSRLAPGMREQIPPIQELWCKVHCK